MKSLRDYIAESQHRAVYPAAGDEFVFEFDDGTEVATYIIETSDDEILVAANPATIAAMEQWCGLSDILYEDEDFSKCEAVFEMAPVVSALGRMAAGSALSNLLDRDDNKDEEFDHGRMREEEANTSDPLADKAAALAPVSAQGDQDPVDTVDEDMTAEAEYRGRKVALNKPTRGDVKKFKVYVKDPKTGNIKKVNFGHGGTSAKRAGQKTMKIKKSNPARRRSFRARHNCDNPGPKTKARYWSCRAW